MIIDKIKDLFSGKSNSKSTKSFFSTLNLAVSTLSFDKSVSEARKYLEALSQHYVVITKHDRVLGVVCVCDLALADPNAFVDVCIQGPIILISSTDTLKDAADTMRREDVGCLPVMFRGNMIGILTRAHLQNTGMLRASLSKVPVCSACQSGQHVRFKDGSKLMAFCKDCMQHMDEYIPFAECGGEAGSA